MPSFFSLQAFVTACCSCTRWSITVRIRWTSSSNFLMRSADSASSVCVSAAPVRM